jgi:anti-sigma regulatory factor (Ser/Thr protein kinase)
MIIDAEPASALIARQAVADELSQRGAAAALVADAKLVVSELVTNSIRHAASDREPISLHWNLLGRGIRVSVTSTQLPTLLRSLRAGGARGAEDASLTIVAKIADRWGIRRDRGRPDLTTAWAYLGTTRSHS